MKAMLLMQGKKEFSLRPTNWSDYYGGESIIALIIIKIQEYMKIN